MVSPDDPGQQPPGPDGDAGILRERDRIAMELQNEVIQRLFSIGMNLQSTMAITTDPLVRRRLDKAINDLDRVVMHIRDTVFELHSHLEVQGLRAGIVQLSERLSPVPDVLFQGPVDGALHPSATIELLDLLADALAAIGDRWAPASVRVTAGDGTHVTVLQAVPLLEGIATSGSDGEFAGLHARAADAGVRVEIEHRSESVQISWHAV